MAPAETSDSPGLSGTISPSSSRETSVPEAATDDNPATAIDMELDHGAHSVSAVAASNHSPPHQSRSSPPATSTQGDSDDEVQFIFSAPRRKKKRRRR
jgi:hypothetical protein